jgi:regulator of replication initiation timing
VDNQTNIDISRPFIVFDIKDLPDEVKPMYMYIILDFITNRAKEDLERKAIVVDEGWSLLNQEKSAEHLLWLIKASRKFNTGMTFITQEVNDLLGSKVGESILANTATKILLAQDSATINLLGDVLHLNMKERNFLVTAKRGDGLLVLENTIRVPVSIKASPKEHDLITTNPDELRKMEAEKESKETKEKEEKDEKKSGFPKDKVVKIHKDGRIEVCYGTHDEADERCAFDPNKIVYKESEITPALAKKLRDEGYADVCKNPFGSGANERYFVKARPNENNDHAFFTWVVEQEAKKYTDDVKIYDTVGPDVVFLTSMGYVAVEVETGQHKGTKQEREEKFHRLKEDYYDYFTLVAFKEFKSEYEKLGRAITRTQLQDTIESYFKGSALGNGGGKNGLS